MKIDPTLSPIGNTTTNPASRESKPATAATVPATGVNTERIDISSLSAQLQKAGEAPFDATRVEGIRQAIAEGRFQIGPERIAGSLLDSARELLVRQRQ
ncbi:flagellar biosynthesis anti-sigma factor FlgM [Sulfuricystis multivorans]|uniref:flagellar biosynthesis anti-sigma factor FlgM n=1 Tax=Sulfuricystis multivorans TaxID=2211108 RepID=UPI0015592135|nr:flagellar biosynthesis anti-sigma factor FlgM [Sulfuricystis multivorans]